VNKNQYSQDGKAEATASNCPSNLAKTIAIHNEERDKRRGIVKIASAHVLLLFVP
jgi:hypothetical protein